MFAYLSIYLSIYLYSPTVFATHVSPAFPCIISYGNKNRKKRRFLQRNKVSPGEYTEPGYETGSARSLQGPLLTDARYNDLSRGFVGESSCRSFFEKLMKSKMILGVPSTKRKTIPGFGFLFALLYVFGEYLK